MKISITPGQRKQVLRFVEDATEKALEEVGLDNPGAQRVIERGDEFQSRVITVIRELSVSNQFANEEVESSCEYPAGYKRKDFCLQSNLLRQLFPGVGFHDEKELDRPLPEGAEGPFAVPRWEKIAPTYGEAVEKVFAMIASKRKFRNYRESQLGPQYLRQTGHSKRFWKQIGEEQKDHDILVVPCQFGLRHKGRSVRRACEVMSANEFGLGAFAVGVMLLTHPERLARYEDLWIDCAGDEYSFSAGSQFDYAPIFSFVGGLVRFGAYWRGGAGGYRGSASGFLQ
ncbi:MAG: hypothetical protein Q8L24_02525 [bacterium]|nr:hypothetical protein [bacterium]